MVVIDGISALRELARSWGISADDLHGLADSLDAAPLTVAHAVDTVLPTLPAPSRATYEVALRRLCQGVPGVQTGSRLVAGVGGLGACPLGDIRLDDLRTMRDRIRATVGAQRVRDRAGRGRCATFPDEDAHGYGAANTFVQAAKSLYTHAVNMNLCATNPALGLKELPHRPYTPHLTMSQLDEVIFLAGHTGPDPWLAELIMEYYCRTGWRREAALNQTLIGVDIDQGTLRTSQKGGGTHELPVPRPLLRRIHALARERGAAQPADLAFRARTGRPITRRFIADTFARVKEQAAWGAGIELGSRVIRHTVLTQIQRLCGDAAAAAWAGHAWESRRTTYAYIEPFGLVELRDIAIRVWGPFDS